MSSKFSHLTEPKHWAEWFEKCALALCGAETTRALGIFAHLRYKQAFDRAMADRKKCLDDLPPEARELIDSTKPGTCWFDFEASCWYSNKPQPQPTGKAPADGSKTYKIFYREVFSNSPTAEEARNVFEGSATKYLIWTRCRSIITKSIFQGRGPINEPGKSSKGNDVEKQSDHSSVAPSLEAEMKDEAARIFTGLSREERILLYACFNEKPLEELPGIEALLGRKKSALYQRQSAAKSKIRSQLDAGDGVWQDGGNHSYRGGVLLRLQEFLNDWANSLESRIRDCLKCHVRNP